jgi:hypothetical protein
MSKFIRMTSLAAAAALIGATPALAAPVGPSGGRNATATARIIKPLTLTWEQDLDLGTILLSGPGAWTGATVSLSHDGYNVTGTNTQVVTIISPDTITLTNANNALQTLVMTVSCPGGAGTGDCPGSVALGNSGALGVDFNLGGSITVDSTTGDGVYSGTFDVTVDYS